MHVPPIFVSFGAGASSELASWGAALPAPRGIVAVGPWWREPALTRSSASASASASGHGSGLAELAYELHELALVERSEREPDPELRSLVARLFPALELPVLQLSLVSGVTPRAHYAVGRKVGQLAERGVLVMAVGALTRGPAHEGDLVAEAEPLDWAKEQDSWVANTLADAQLEDVLRWRTESPHPQLAHPDGASDLEPLFLVAGAASLYDHAVGFPVRGFTAGGALSRRCIQFGR